MTPESDYQAMFMAAWLTMSLRAAHAAAAQAVKPVARPKAVKPRAATITITHKTAGRAKVAGD